MNEIVLIIIILLLLFYIFKDLLKDTFSNKQEKANTIFSWFSNNPNPEYIKYKSDIKDSDIVEYLEAKKLKKENKLLSQKDIYNLL